MRRLMLLRHAKSDWSRTGESQRPSDDHARPLAARGREAAPRVGRYMSANGYVPALVLCSTAVRTRETLELVLSAWNTTPEIRYEENLYLAEWPRLLDVLREAPASATPLLMVGHNPGLEQLARALAREPKKGTERALAESLSRKFPTAALVVFSFPGADWRGVQPGAGRLTDFVRPKDLKSSKNGEAD